MALWASRWVKKQQNEGIRKRTDGAEAGWAALAPWQLDTAVPSVLASHRALPTPVPQPGSLLQEKIATGNKRKTWGIKMDSFQLKLPYCNFVSYQWQTKVHGSLTDKEMSFWAKCSVQIFDFLACSVQMVLFCSVFWSGGRKAISETVTVKARIDQRHTRLPECMRMYRIIAGNPHTRVRTLRRIFSKAICWRHYQVHLEQWFVWLIRNLPCCCWMPVKTRNILFTRCKEKRLLNNKMFHYIPACYINLGMLLYIKKLCPLHFLPQSLLYRDVHNALPPTLQER